MFGAVAAAAKMASNAGVKPCAVATNAGAAAGAASGAYNMLSGRGGDSNANGKPILKAELEVEGAIDDAGMPVEEREMGDHLKGVVRMAALDGNVQTTVQEVRLRITQYESRELYLMSSKLYLTNQQETMKSKAKHSEKLTELQKVHGIPSASFDHRDASARNFLRARVKGNKHMHVDMTAENEPLRPGTDDKPPGVDDIGAMPEPEDLDACVPFLGNEKIAVKEWAIEGALTLSNQSRTFTEVPFDVKLPGAGEGFSGSSQSGSSYEKRQQDKTAATEKKGMLAKGFAMARGAAPGGGETSKMITQTRVDEVVHGRAYTVLSLVVDGVEYPFAEGEGAATSSEVLLKPDAAAIKATVDNTRYSTPLKLQTGHVDVKTGSKLMTCLGMGTKGQSALAVQVLDSSTGQYVDLNSAKGDYSHTVAPGERINLAVTVDNSKLANLNQKDLGTTVKLVKTVYATALEKNDEKNPTRCIERAYLDKCGSTLKTFYFNQVHASMQSVVAESNCDPATLSAGNGKPKLTGVAGGSTKTTMHTLAVPADGSVEYSYAGHYYRVRYHVEVETRFPGGRSGKNGQIVNNPMCTLPLAVVPFSSQVQSVPNMHYIEPVQEAVAVPVPVPVQETAYVEPVQDAAPSYVEREPMQDFYAAPTYEHQQDEYVDESSSVLDVSASPVVVAGASPRATPSDTRMQSNDELSAARRYGGRGLHSPTSSRSRTGSLVTSPPNASRSPRSYSRNSPRNSPRSASSSAKPYLRTNTGSGIRMRELRGENQNLLDTLLVVHLGYEKTASRSRPGEYTYYNPRTGESWSSLSKAWKECVEMGYVAPTDAMPVM